MRNWWDSSPDERYWCEVTDRSDLGSDLKAPQKNEAGQDYWSYALIKEVMPGDIVFHYSTRKRAFAGASVAGGPMEERPITWTPHGTSGRAKSSVRDSRAGYWRPLYGYRPATHPLTLRALEEPGESTWIRSWIDTHKSSGPPRLPLQVRKDGLRAGQGYLFKMPADFVERWQPLRELADILDERSEELSGRVSADLSVLQHTASEFHPKSDAEYTAVISATVQHRSRTHEKLVRLAGQWLQARGVLIANRHPKDLEIISPVSVIVEAKIVGPRDPSFALREALGQLHEYKYFIGPRTAELAVLLDAEPPTALIRYSEDHLQVAVLWLVDATLTGGPLAQSRILTAITEAPRRILAGPWS